MLMVSVFVIKMYCFYFILDYIIIPVYALLLDTV